jgi:hypothetical protein
MDELITQRPVNRQRDGRAESSRALLRKPNETARRQMDRNGTDTFRQRGGSMILRNVDMHGLCLQELKLNSMV